MTAILLRYNQPALKVPANKVKSVTPHSGALLRVALESEEVLCYHIKIE